MGRINEVILIDMEENGKNAGTSLVPSGSDLQLREPMALFPPSGAAGPTASPPGGQTVQPRGVGGGGRPLATPT